jgi:hypothetical protein
MAQTNLEISSGAIYALLVTFTRADGAVFRYARWDNDVTSNGQTFLCEPSLSLIFTRGEQGGTDDTYPDLQMVNTRVPFDGLCQLFPYPKVDVVVEEVSPGDDSTRQELYSGRIGRMTVNPSGSQGTAKAKLSGVKSRLQGAMGIQAMTTCAWSLGMMPCLFNLAAATLTGTVAEVNTDSVPNRVKITLAGTPDMQNAKWNRGYLEVGGCRVIIRRSYNDSNWKFELREIPPPGWVGQPVTLVPGCDKQIATCRIHGQESQFGGFGYGMPDHNPVFFAG